MQCYNFLVDKLFHVGSNSFSCFQLIEIERRARCPAHYFFFNIGCHFLKKDSFSFFESKNETKNVKTEAPCIILVFQLIKNLQRLATIEDGSRLKKNSSFKEKGSLGQLIVNYTYANGQRKQLKRDIFYSFHFFCY